MQLHVLYAQRKESYPGEYAPEILAAIDENGMSDNPEYMELEVETAKKSNEFENIVVVTMSVDGAAIMGMLRPASKVLQAQIVG